MIEIRKEVSEDYSFVLKAESGHVLLKSVPFSNKKVAIDIANGLSSFVVKSSNFERKTNHNGQFLFNFKNNEGVLIGSSQLYNSEAGMENGIKNLTNRITLISSEEKL